MACSSQELSDISDNDPTLRTTQGEPKSGYWSYRSLQEDKKRCLTDLPHSDHTRANTLEFLHEDKPYHSGKAVRERTKLHQGLGNESWRRRPSTPTHPFASNVDSQRQFWSHADLVAAKRKLNTTLTKPSSPTLKGDVEPSSAREPASARERRRDYDDGGKIPFSARSPESGSFRSMRSGSEASRASKLPSGAQSPTIAQLIQHQANIVEDHPHNESAAKWWGTVRETRDIGNPHRSHEKFEIKKHHHKTQIHQNYTPGSTTEATPRTMLYQREFTDPKMSAVRGEYPHGHHTNEAWGPSQGDGTPPSRYASCELLTLDKRRHATPIDGGHKKTEQRRVKDAYPGAPSSPGMESERSGRDGISNTNDKKNLFRSNFTMQQHKRKHLAELKSNGLRGGMLPTASNGPTPALAGSFSAGRVGCPTPAPEAKGGSGFYSHRELQYCKRFNTVSLRAAQDLQEGDVADRPWPKPGNKLDDYARSPSESNFSSSTPPYPAAPAREPQTSQGRSHHIGAITKYSPKSGVRDSVGSSASDPILLHSSQQELSDRKANCQTAMRHAQSPRAGSTFRDERPRGSDPATALALRRDPGGGAMSSQRQLEYSKTVHRFAHDDPRRKRPVPTPCPVPPTPRSGQWTPAHC